MYIEPNSNIKIYHNVPLDNTFNHTLYFSGLAAQNAYFHGNQSILKYNLTAQSYQRVVKGSMRVAVKADNLYDCNYLAFQNASFGTKWFYAFITSVEYVNNETSEITFEIDPMQTYLADYDLMPCYVEREHSLTDNIGDNIQAEPVDCGEYIYSDFENLSSSNMCVIVCVVDSTSTAGVGNLYDGIYGGCDLWAFNSSDASGITDFVNSYLLKPDEIVSIYMCPADLLGTIAEGGTKLGYGSNSKIQDKTLDSPTTASTDFDGYTPKNKKLYTYPYNYCEISNGSGSSLALRYEFFEDLTPMVRIEGCLSMPVSLVVRPLNYKGMKNATYSTNRNECISIDNYPLCSWSVDTFKAWCAQNCVPMAVNGLVSLSTGRVSAGSLIDTGLSIYNASIQADQCRGNVNSGNVNIGRGEQLFTSSRCHITKDFCRVIDGYFSMYGYATNKVKVPYRTGRPHWNYVKTRKCIIKGNMPTDDIRKICNIYDSGITFWANPSEVGDYTLDNSPS